jgi:hypothetical protein
MNEKYPEVDTLEFFLRKTDFLTRKAAPDSLPSLVPRSAARLLRKRSGKARDERREHVGL